MSLREQLEPIRARLWTPPESGQYYVSFETINSTRTDIEKLIRCVEEMNLALIAISQDCTEAQRWGTSFYTMISGRSRNARAQAKFILRGAG